MQQYIPLMTSFHYCTDVATRAEVAWGCLGLVAKAGGGGLWGKAFGTTVAGG